MQIHVVICKVLPKTLLLQIQMAITYPQTPSGSYTHTCSTAIYQTLEHRGLFVSEEWDRNGKEETGKRKSGAQKHII